MSKLTDSGLKVLKKRILQGETPAELWRRVSTAVAAAEKPEDQKEYQEEFEEVLSELDFLPNSPCLTNAGRKLGQLAACFVLPITDSMEGIFDAVKNMALVQRSGGGTGFDFSTLRPEDSPVSTTKGKASGPISFMRVFNAATEEVKQGGIRRGANMAILRVDHPDILKFITCKDAEGVFENFNISVGITDEFMHAVEIGGEYELKWNEQSYGKLNALMVLNLIVEQAHKNGEPGVLFLDTINASNPIINEIIRATNPCGEQPLLANEACDLGSLNLLNMYDEQTGDINWRRVRIITEIATRFLDDVISINSYPLEVIKQKCQMNRKIGLGVMGWADLLYALEIPYDSNEAINLATKVEHFINDAAHTTSMELGKEKGNFPNIKNSRYQNWEYLRNATCTTIAPTGTLSMIAQVSSSIEPAFGLVFTKTVLDGTPFHYVNPIFEKHLHENYDEAIIPTIIEKVAATGSCQNIEELSDATKSIFKIAQEISVGWHVNMQAAFQANLDNAVSKTINLANSATKEDVLKAITLGYKLKCKGMTIYRDGSRQEQVLTMPGATDKTIPENTVKTTISKPEEWPTERPRRLYGYTEKIPTGCGSMYVTVNFACGKPYETFVTTGGNGGCAAHTAETGRLVSLMLQKQFPLNEIIKQLKAPICPNFIRQAERKEEVIGKSCPAVVGELLDNVGTVVTELVGETKVEVPNREDDTFECPECHLKLEHAGGCVVCPNCGWGKC